MTSTVVLARFIPDYVVGKWYQSVPGILLAGGAAPTANKLYLLPFFIHKDITISDLQTRVTTLASGGKFQLAIYANDNALGAPTGAALAVTADMSTTSATVVQADIIGADVRLTGGWYWMAIMSDATAGGVAMYQCHSAAQSYAGYFFGSVNGANISLGTATGALRLEYANPSAYGTWPDLTGVTFTEGSTSNYAIIGFKVGAL